MAVKFFEKLLTLFLDIISINVAYMAAFWLRYKSGVFSGTFDPAITIAGHYSPMMIITISWLFLFFLTGLYRTWYKESRVDESFVVLKAVLAGNLLFFAMISGSDMQEFLSSGRLSVLFSQTRIVMIGTYTLCMFFFVIINRLAKHTILGWIFQKGFVNRVILIVGANESGRTLFRELISYPHMGYRIAGFIDDDGRKKESDFCGLKVLGTYSEIAAICKKENVSGIIISEVSSSANEISRIISFCGDLNITIFMAPSLRDVITGHLKSNQVFGVPLIVLLQDHMPSWEAQIKRLMDIVVSALVLVLGFPFWLLIVVVIRSTSKGPAVYCQERIGRDGKPFIMMKFRSMFEDAEVKSGPKWATENDPRITPVGRFLRKTRLDEIPQFLNVLKGEMSLVGPRPERAFFIEQLKNEIPWYVRRIKMKPGITGWAQVKHKYDETIEDVKMKVMYDLYYFENMSILLDIKIIIRTIMVVFTGKGAH